MATLAVACAAGEGTGVTPPPPPDGPATLSRHVQPIFTASCAFAGGCHAGAEPQRGMNLSAGQAYANTVNVASSEVPRLLRIQPGNPDSSYLVLKIEGNAGLVGDFGARMPLGGQLTQEEIATVREWVMSGAPNN